MKYIFEESDIKAGLLFSDGSPKMVVTHRDKTSNSNEPYLYAILDLQTGTINCPFVTADKLAAFLTGFMVRPLRTEQVFNEEEY
jgi:hypothetical protein